MINSNRHDWNIIAAVVSKLKVLLKNLIDFSFYICSEFDKIREWITAKLRIEYLCANLKYLNDVELADIID